MIRYRAEAAELPAVANVEVLIHQAPASSLKNVHFPYQANTDSKLPISLHYYQVNTDTVIVCEEYYSINHFGGFSSRQACLSGGTGRVGLPSWQTCTWHGGI